MPGVVLSVCVVRCTPSGSIGIGHGHHEERGMPPAQLPLTHESDSLRRTVYPSATAVPLGQMDTPHGRLLPWLRLIGNLPTWRPHRWLGSDTRRTHTPEADCALKSDR